MLLTKTFSAEQYCQVLEWWGRIGLDGKTPVLSSLFGDTFLETADGYWFLDSIEGSLTRPWDDRAAVQSDLDTPEGQDRYLLAGLAMAAERRGVTLGPNEVYDLVLPPILGGSFDPENVATADFVVALNIAGQLHDQVRSLPAGTKISGVTIEGSPSAGPTDQLRPRRRQRAWGKKS